MTLNPNPEMNPMDPITNLTATARIMHAHLEALTPAAMSLVTPCADWTVAELATHVVDNALFFAGAAGADAQPEPGPAGKGAERGRHVLVQHAVGPEGADELVGGPGVALGGVGRRDRAELGLGVGPRSAG
ncbi:MAG: maleylpyruvate isomerase N-terminal domain-containing protein, partial [Actinomycetota bacterium]